MPHASTVSAATSENRGTKTNTKENNHTHQNNCLMAAESFSQSPEAIADFSSRKPPTCFNNESFRSAISMGCGRTPTFLAKLMAEVSAIASAPCVAATIATSAIRLASNCAAVG